MDGRSFLEDGERLELDVRRFGLGSAVLIATWALPEILVLLGGYFVFRFSDRIGPGAAYLYLALLAIFILFALIAYATVIIYQRNRLILTNRRIIFITQYGLSGHRVAQCHLEFIQDVSTSHDHVIAEMFDYGDITIETSGKSERFVFPTCKDPHKVAARIVRACKQVDFKPKSEEQVKNLGLSEATIETNLPSIAGPNMSELPDLPFELPGGKPISQNKP